MTTVYRPALDVIQAGGSVTIVDGDGNIQQIIGTQPDGTVGITHQNGPPPPAVSTPVVTDATLGLTVTWDGLLADQQPGPTLNANSDFEAGVDFWTAAGAALTQSDTQAHGGTSSGLLTPDGAASTVSVSSELDAVTAGASYQVSGWAWPADAVTNGFSLSVDWYDVDSQPISTDQDLGDLTAAEWSEVLRTLTAPSGAAFASITVTLTTGDPETPVDGGQLLYVDDLALKPVTLATPTGFDHVAVHVSETTGFTPDSTTFLGTLTHAGSFPVSPLDGGTEYFVRLVGVNTSGIAGDPSTQASGTPSEVVATSADFTARDIGGITTSVGSTEPASPLAGDIWINTSGTGSQFQQYSGTDWVPIQWDTESFKADSVTAAVIAAATILGTNIAADQIEADHLKANSVTLGKVDAGAIDAAALAAVIALISTLICGDPAGQRVQIDDTGINQYDVNGNSLVMMAGGNAIFRGGLVSVSELDTSNVIINAGDNGAILMYGQLDAALNPNPDMVSGITGWSTSGGTTISYSATHQHNGHNTLRMVSSTDSGLVDLTSFASGITAGQPYTLDVLILLSDNSTTVVPEIVWFSSSNANLGSVVGSPIGGSLAGNFRTGSVTGIAPAGATQFDIVLNFYSPTSGAAYVAHAAVSGPGIVASLSAAGGTDQYGTDYPAGLHVAGDVDLGPVCRLYTTSTKGLPSKTNYVVSWDSAEYDTVAGGGSWNPAAPTRFACTKAGIYRFTGTANMLTFSARLIVNFQKNGTVLSGRNFGWSGASRTTAQFSRQIKLAVGDYVEMLVFNDAASASTMPSNTDDQPCLEVEYVHS